MLYPHLVCFFSRLNGQLDNDDSTRRFHETLVELNVDSGFTVILCIVLRYISCSAFYYIDWRAEINIARYRYIYTGLGRHFLEQVSSRHIFQSTGPSLPCILYISG